MRLWKRVKPDEDMSEETAADVVLEEAKEVFWESAGESLNEAAIKAGKNFNESKNQIDQAAKEIYQKSEAVAADWKLPPAVIIGLPGDTMVALNYENLNLSGGSYVN